MRLRGVCASGSSPRHLHDHRARVAGRRRALARRLGALALRPRRRLRQPQLAQQLDLDLGLLQERWAVADHLERERAVVGRPHLEHLPERAAPEVP